MKKKFLSLAIAAAGVGVMAACAQKSAKAEAEGTDAAAPASEAAPEASAPAGPTVEQATYAVALPQGWSVLSEDEREAVVYKGDNPAQMLDNPCLTIKVYKAEGSTLDDDFREMVEGMGAKPASDVTIGGVTYKAATLEEGGQQSPILLGEQNGSRVCVTIANAQATDADVQAVIGSVKVK